MDKIAQTIKNRLSLRPPQADSLNILAELANELNMKKNSDLKSALETIKQQYPTCVDFERNFPSICFALATGVGKTRLMGAFITYLYLAKKIKNFFVLAPNLTIYNKLIDDFSNPASPKYVFQGIGEYVANSPHIITGDNYQNYYGYKRGLYENDININIFNISKINAETRSGKDPKIKRLSEYLGDSYFNQLAQLEDLVLLMDESHHYRASRGVQVIDELNPILGLELTATPQVERAGKSIKFKNVVYEYSLAKAIRDGFVKEPAAATRKNFDPSGCSPEELDRIKLEDGIRIHEDTKVALDIYSRDYNAYIVKPFVLVVAKDTTHASKLKEIITSQNFFNGYYSNKVMEIHSEQRGAEKEGNIEKLISLESHTNKIEIVIHVNMLKEGWDVTNLYTIIPLRTAASLTLREQTIGRGLRLPYGKRTGVDKVDKLTIVSHDKFQELIAEANKPDSIIKQENIIQIEVTEQYQPKEVITSTSKQAEQLIEEHKKIEEITHPEEKEKARRNLEIKETIFKILPALNTQVRNVKELNKEEIKTQVIERIKTTIFIGPQRVLYADEIIKNIEKSLREITVEFINNIIEIPRIVIQPKEEIKAGFHDFNLDTNNLSFQPVSEEILIRKLREQENNIDIIIGQGGFYPDKPEKIIVNELINYPEIDYDSQKELLFKLAYQAVIKFGDYLPDDEKIMNVVQYHKRDIGKYIYAQMMERFYCEPTAFEKPQISPFTKIEDHNYSRNTFDSTYHFTETITPTKAIPEKVFVGFKKAYHTLYKFDSKSEKDFAVILEQDGEVLKWLRPARNQFRIYWNHNSSQYQPDFVVETGTAIFLVEIKKETDIGDKEVKEKAGAAVQYCLHASGYTAENGGKPWKYLLIPHNAVMYNMSFDILSKHYIYTA